LQVTLSELHHTITPPVHIQSSQAMNVKNGTDDFVADSFDRAAPADVPTSFELDDPELATPATFKSSESEDVGNPIMHRSPLQRLRGDVASRTDHLTRLRSRRKAMSFIEAQATRRMSQDNTAKIDEVDGDVSTDEADDDESTDSCMDPDVLNDLKSEMMKESDEQTSSKFQELQKITAKYTVGVSNEILVHKNPLEVRLDNFTYCVQVAATANKVQTVYTQSPFYAIARRIKRLWKVDANHTEPELVEKKVLDRITLQFKPGKSYLVLGAPGSGKTSLLRAVAGLIRRSKNDSLEGTITYNGKTLHVSD
jgi:ABC-type multidrug transport system fused ATPase/permease subunit